MHLTMEEWKVLCILYDLKKWMPANDISMKTNREIGIGQVIEINAMLGLDNLISYDNNARDAQINQKGIDWMESAGNSRGISV
jgi:hypothetical protein